MLRASEVVLVVNNLPNNMDERDSRRIPGSENPLEEGMKTHSSILAWRIPWTEEPGGLQSIGLQRVRMKQLSMHTETLKQEDDRHDAVYVLKYHFAAVWENMPHCRQWRTNKCLTTSYL